MTGELSLRGKALAIGGLKEKTMAAYSCGIKTVLIPADNVKDLDKIDKEARANLRIIPCENVKDVLDNALVTPKAFKKTAASVKPDMKSEVSKSITGSRVRRNV